jgi:hypothetical protein
MALEDESRAIDDVVDRIATRFPDLTKDLIRDQVEALLSRFDDSTIRDFVPILIERETIDLLAHSPGSD